jgi:hypothetical protein
VAGVPLRGPRPRHDDGLDSGQGKRPQQIHVSHDTGAARLRRRHAASLSVRGA